MKAELTKELAKERAKLVAENISIVNHQQKLSQQLDEFQARRLQIEGEIRQIDKVSNRLQEIENQRKEMLKGLTLPVNRKPSDLP